MKKSILFIGFIFFIAYSVFGQISLEKEFGDLFKEVQMNSVFDDSKTFVDCSPKYSTEKILRSYTKRKTQKSFDLKKFVYANFELPQGSFSGYKSNPQNSVIEHINELWPVLTRESGIQKGSIYALPYPYVVPGGRFREIYYWDSYFTMLGLQVSGKVETIENMIDNFAYLIDNLGFIPNGNRTYFKGRSQPPFFSLMISLLAEEKGDSIIIKYLPFVQKEYNFWMNGANQLSKSKNNYKRVVLLPDGSILNRYYGDESGPRPESYKEDVRLSMGTQVDKEQLFLDLRAAAESGWDFSTRWFKDSKSMETIHTTEIIPVDLNSLLCHIEKFLSKAYGLAEDEEKQVTYFYKSLERSAAIKRYCWNIKEGYYTDYDFVNKEQKRTYSMAGAFPLFLDIASNEEARFVAAKLKKDFLKPGGFTSTLTNSGQQWDSPNGWAPLQWVGIKGLRNYGFDELAEKAKNNWTNVNINVYNKTNKMVEKYNVLNLDIEGGGGEYPVQDGFGWSNGVLLKLMTE